MNAGQSDKRLRADSILTLGTLCLAQFIVVVSLQGTSISLPLIQKEMGWSTATAHWLVSANVLAFGGLVLVGGRIADLFGRRRLFMVGLTLFSVATIVAGLAPSGGWLIAARVAQGAGTAMFFPAALGLLAALFPDGSTRHRAVATWGAAGPLGGITALALGGALIGAFGWKIMFVFVVPFALLALVIARFVIPPDTLPRTGSLNLCSAIFGACGTALLVYGLGDLSRTGLSPTGLAGSLLGVVLLAAFVRRERRAEAPLVPPALRQRRQIRNAVAVSFLHGSTTSPLFFYFLFLQQVQQAPPLETGLGFIPCNLGIIAGAAVAKCLVERWSFAAVMAPGMAIVGSGLLALTTITTNGAYARTLLPGLLLCGLGLGLAQVGIVGTAAAGAEPAERGIAAGLVPTSSQVGTAVGLSLLVAVASRFSGPYPDQLVAGFRAAFVAGAGLGVVGVLTAILGMRQRTAFHRDCTAVAPSPAPTHPPNWAGRGILPQ